MEKIYPISNFYSRKAIVLYLIALAVVSVIFINKTLPLHWILFGIIEVVAFFYFLNTLSRKWTLLPEKVFLRKVFVTALVIRIIYVVFSYFFYSWMTGEPFEFSAGDAHFYDGLGVEIQQFGLSYIGNILGFGVQISDIGHPTYLGLIYLIFTPIVIIPRLISTIFSAWMCVLLYKFSKRNFGDASARYTAIIAMILPHFIYYCGLHLKETNMIFLVALFMERADYVIRSEKLSIKDLIVVVLSGAVLFLFRTVLAVSVWFAFFSALLFSKSKAKGWSKRIVLFFWFSIAALIIFSGRIEREVDVLWQARESNQSTSMEWRSVRKGGNSLAKYGSGVFFAPVIFIAPFPTMVNVEHQQNQMYQNGTYVVKNVMAFFTIVALILIIFKYKTYRNHVQLLVFVFSYLGIIAFSAFALSERFHLPALPFLMVLAGFGIDKITKKQKQFYVPYLVFIAIAIIGWNVFKIAGRGGL